MLEQLRQNVAGHVDRNGEADALGGPDHGRVDADDLAAAVNQWTAAVARVEGGVGLDDVIDQVAGDAAQGPPEGADDAGRDGRFEAERAADGDDELADAAGIDDGDILLSLGDLPAASVDDLHKLLTQLPVGIPTPVVFLRDGRKVERMVIPADYPIPTGS